MDQMLYLRFENFMGDFDDLAEVNLIGPYPDQSARARELARLDGLPLGGPEYNGGYRFHLHDDITDGAVRVVAPGDVAAADTINAFFDAFFGWPGEHETEDDIHPDQAVLPLCPPAEPMCGPPTRRRVGTRP
jgi:hypothetical protein